MMNFWQVINQNVEKKQKKNVHKQIYIGVTDISKFYKVFVHIVKVDSVFKNSGFAYILYICMKHFQHQEIRKNKSKLNFGKNRWVS